MTPAQVDHSHVILVFALPVYFEKNNCVMELVRATLRNKRIIVLLPDRQMHGAFTMDMIANIITDEWVAKWAVDKKVAEWSASWGLPEAVKPPTAADIRAALSRHPPLEWSRIAAFQDHTMVAICQHTAPEQQMYLEGTQQSSDVPPGHTPIKVYCSPHNAGVREIVRELCAPDRLSTGSRRKSSSFVPDGLSRVLHSEAREAAPRSVSSSKPSSSNRSSDKRGSTVSSSSSRRGSKEGSRRGSINRQATLSVLRRSLTVSTVSEPKGSLLEVVDTVEEGQVMLLLLDASTWSHNPEALADEILEARRLGLDIQMCHEFPSALDDESCTRKTAEFDDIISTTPHVLRTEECNIYAESVAVPLKGSMLRAPSLALLAQALIFHADERKARSREKRPSKTGQHVRTQGPMARLSKSKREKQDRPPPLALSRQQSWNEVVSQLETLSPARPPVMGARRWPAAPPELAPPEGAPPAVAPAAVTPPVVAPPVLEVVAQSASPRSCTSNRATAIAVELLQDSDLRI